MKNFILVALIAFTSCAGQTKNNSTVDNDTILQTDTIINPAVRNVDSAVDTIHRFDSTVYEQVVSKEALNILKQILPGWRLPDPTSYEAVWFNYYKKDDALVDYIHADFNCDRRQDYAFILENPSTNELAAWVLQSNGPEHTAIQLEKLNREGYISKGYEIVSRGEQIQDFDTRSSVNPNKIVKLGCEAIRVQDLGGPSRIYFWDTDSFKRTTETD